MQLSYWLSSPLVHMPSSKNKGVPDDQPFCSLRNRKNRSRLFFDDHQMGPVENTSDAVTLREQVRKEPHSKIECISQHTSYIVATAPKGEVHESPPTTII